MCETISSMYIHYFQTSPAVCTVLIIKNILHKWDMIGMADCIYSRNKVAWIVIWARVYVKIIESCCLRLAVCVSSVQIYIIPNQTVLHCITNKDHINVKVSMITSITSTTFYYNISKEGNSLPEESREIRNTTSVKWELKKYLYIRAEQRSALTSVFY